MNNEIQKNSLKILSIIFFIIAATFSLYALFFQEASSNAKSVVFTSLAPEQEAWIMTSALIALLGIGCLLSSLKKK